MVKTESFSTNIYSNTLYMLNALWLTYFDVLGKESCHSPGVLRIRKKELLFLYIIHFDEITIFFIV